MLAPIPFSNRARLEGPAVASYSVAPRTDPNAASTNMHSKPIGAGGTEAFRKIITNKAKR